MAITAVVALATGLAYAQSADATASTKKLAHGVHTTSTAGLLAAAQASPSRPRSLGGNPASTGEPGSSTGLPAGVPSTGNYAFLLKLSATPTMSAYNTALASGSKASAKSAAKAQLAAVTSAQNAVVAALPAHSSVLYKMHAVLSGVTVLTNVDNFAALQKIKGVTAVYPIAPKAPSNSYAVPLQKAPQAWTAYGDLGANSTVGIIDTGVDYTHRNMGGIGTVTAFDDDSAALGAPVDDPADFPGTKVIGGYDLAGDNYEAGVAGHDVPAPDPYPLDCNGHGSHVAGTVAGYGENANGTTYTGAYNNSTPFSTMRIGPGMAPKAKLYAFRVFGCAGSTDLVSAAIDMAADPNGDGDPSDHVDVVNMSLGSDFGSPQDGDSVTTAAASEAGITMVVASGNGGDLYDVGGSPGDVSQALTVAASTDNYAQVDALNLTAPTTVSYGAERSVAFHWGTGSPSDLSGDVVQVTQAGNTDGCDALDGPTAAAVAGKIAFVEWTDLGTRRCGSAVRAGNLAAAGASGFIFADDTDAFSAGITGSAVIPGVLVSKTGGDFIRTQLVANTPVHVGSTTANGFPQFVTGHDDQVASFSSRGIGDVNNVKPDVSAVGETVFSTGSGTGDQGLNDSGTSMATPMVAGTAALVKSQHADWTPEQVKADIMNTAEQDLFTGPNHTGTKYAPQRVGSGRIDVKAALDNGVLAYNAVNHGAVSVSFGEQAISAPTTFTKAIKVQNTTLAPVTYTTSFNNRTSIPGATYSVTPASVTVAARSAGTVTVTLTVDPTQLTKTIDPTVDRFNSGLPRIYQADASGLLLLKSAGSPTLNVPVYAAPRPASTMTQPSSLTLPDGAQQSVTMPLTGGGIDQGSGNKEVTSLVAGFELGATSPALSTDFPDEGSADIRAVGVTSDTQQVAALSGNPLSTGLTYFAIQANHAWRTPVPLQEFDIYIDTTGDGVPDFVMFNTTLGAGLDIPVAETINLHTNGVVDAEPLNDALGDTDTALLESNVLVMPVATGALGITAASSRIHYGVLGFTAYQSAPLDSVGITGSNSPTLGFDPLHPGVALYGTVTADTNPLLWLDNPTSTVKVTRDAAAYAADKGQGLMVVHFQNANDTKVQTVSLNKETSTTALAFSPTSIALGSSSTATVTVTGGAAGTPTGSVTLTEGTTTIGTSAVNASGVATFPVTPSTAGTHSYTASYAGDANYASSTANGSLTVTSVTPPAKATPTVTLTPKSTTVKRHHKVRTTVSVSGSAGTPTGTVELGKLVGGSFKVLATGTLSNGTVKLHFVASKAGKLFLQAQYQGDSAYTAGSSSQVKVTITS